MPYLGCHKVSPLECDRMQRTVSTGVTGKYLVAPTDQLISSPTPAGGALRCACALKKDWQFNRMTKEQQETVALLHMTTKRTRQPEATAIHSMQRTHHPSNFELDSDINCWLVLQRPHCLDLGCKEQQQRQISGATEY